MVTDRVLEGLRLTPDDVATHEFAHGFRGYDVHEVRSFLRLVSGEMARLSDDADRSSEAGVGSPVVAVEALSRDRLSDLVGEEAARVLQAAEDAAADIRRRAEENVEKMLREARGEAATLRATADQQRADVIELSEEELVAARNEAAAVLAKAEVDAQRRRDEAVEEGRSMISQAQGAKEKVLRDLAVKRKSLRRELAQLRAGVDQLHESYDELRSMLDTSSLVVDEAVDHARRAAADAAHRFDRSDMDDDLVAVRAQVDRPGAVDPPPVFEGDGRETAAPTDETAAVEAGRSDQERDDPEPALEADTTEVSDVGVAEPGAEQGRDAGRTDLEATDDVAESADGAPALTLVIDSEIEEQVVEGSDVDDAAVPTVAQAAAVRAAEHRTIYRRDPRPVSVPTSIDGAGSAAGGEGSEVASDPVVDQAADADLDVEADAEFDLDVDVDDEAEVDTELDVEVDTARPDLPELLDDGPVPSVGSPPPLFGRGDNNIDELFARIRSSRETAVAEAEAVLHPIESVTARPDEAEDGVDVDGDDIADDSGVVADASDEHADVVADADADADDADVGQARNGRGAAAPADAIDVASSRHLVSAAQMFEELDTTVDALAPQVSRALKRALADQLNEALDACRRADSVDDVDQLIAAGTDEQYGVAVQSLLADAAARGAGQAASVDIASIVADVSRDIGGTIRTRIAGYLPCEEGLDQLVRAAFREWRRERADEVARDSIIGAFNLGVLAALEPGTPVRWVQRDSGCKHPDCGDNSLADDVTAGRPFPTGHTAAPLGPGCRCLVVGSDQ